MLSLCLQNLAYLDTDVEEVNTELRGRPKWRFSAVMDWNISDKFQLVSSFLSVDRFWEVSIPTGGTYLDGYNRVDLSITYRPTEKMRWHAAVDNALGETYQEAVGFPAPDTRVRAGLSYQF